MNNTSDTQSRPPGFKASRVRYKDVRNVNVLFLGLDLPGFLHGSNFLLPWDITVRVEKEKWPTVGETGGKKGKPKRGQKGM